MSASHTIPKLNDPSLFKEQCYVGGSWIDAKSKEKFEVHGKQLSLGQKAMINHGKIRRQES